MWTRPTLKQLHERIGGDFSGRLLDGATPSSRSVIGVLSKVWAGAAHSLHALLEWTFAQVFPDAAEGAYMERWARIWGLYRKDPAAATGVVTVTGIDGAVVPSGTLYLHQASQQRYIVQADATLAAGVATVPLAAETAGTAANLAPGEQLTLIAPIAGVTSAAQVGTDGIVGGVELETDDSLRERLLARLRQPPRGGSKADYEKWALEVPGVTRAWCYPHGEGVGTVSLAFVCDDAVDGPIPSATMVQRVQEHIEPLRPATVREFLAFAPEVLPVEVRLKVSPDTEAVRAAVRAELVDLIAREGEPGAVIPLTHIHEAISISAGEQDHRLLAPLDDVTVPEGYFPSLTVEFEAWA